ncbi:hypothetical protein KQI84_04000 [bacterium]|nr:hypothetical protein [bacterium]
MSANAMRQVWDDEAFDTPEKVLVALAFAVVSTDESFGYEFEIPLAEAASRARIEEDKVLRIVQSLQLSHRLEDVSSRGGVISGVIPRK